MRRGILLAIDVVLVAFATALALLVRDNFEFVTDHWVALFPYFTVSLVTSGAVFLGGGVSQSFWRYSSVVDYLRIVALTTVIVLLAVGAIFAYSRLDGVPRALPLLQGVLIVGALVSARICVRLSHLRRSVVGGPEFYATDAVESILVIGVNAIADLFLRSIQEVAPHKIRIAGVLSEDSMQGRRCVQQNEILGGAEELPAILARLEVHGVIVDRIIIAARVEKLSQRAKELLLELEESSSIVVHFLAERLGFDQSSMNGERGKSPLPVKRQRAIRVLDKDARLPWPALESHA